MGEERGDDGGSRGAAGDGAGAGILEDDAIGGVEAKQGGTAQIWLRMGLAVCDLIGADEALGYAQPGSGQTNTSQALGGGCDDGPAVFRQSTEELRHTGEDGDAILIGDFHVFNAKQLGAIVEVGAQFADCLDSSTAVGGADGEFRIDIVIEGPGAPAALDGAKRGDEHAVHVEEESFAVQLQHSVVGSLGYFGDEWRMNCCGGDGMAESMQRNPSDQGLLAETES